MTSILSLIVFVAGIALIGVSLRYINNEHHVWTGIGLLLGVWIVLKGAPLVLDKYPLPPTFTWKEWVIWLMRFIEEYRIPILGLVSMFLLIEAVVAAVPQWGLGSFGRIDTTTGRGFQVGVFIAMVVLLSISLTWMYNEKYAMNSLYNQLRRLTHGSPGVRVIIRDDGRVDIIQDASTLSPAEIERFKEILEKAAKQDENVDLEVDTIHKVVSRANDGWTIDQLIIGFSGTIEGPTGERLLERTYDLPSHYTQDQSTAWLKAMRDKLESKIDDVQTQPFQPAQAPNLRNNGTIVDPPKPPAFGHL